MSHRVETAKATAEAKIREAEEADFLCFRVRKVAE
jgi:hypothetical protein